MFASGSGRNGASSSAELQPRDGEARDAAAAPAPVRARGRRDAAPHLLRPRGHALRGDRADAATSRSRERLLHDYATHQRARGFSFWAVIERASGALIGDAGLYRTPVGRGRARLHARRGVVGARVRDRGGAARGWTPRSQARDLARWSRSPSRPTSPRCTCWRSSGCRGTASGSPSGARTRCSGRSARSALRVPAASLQVAEDDEVAPVGGDHLPVAAAQRARPSTSGPRPARTRGPPPPRGRRSPRDGPAVSALTRTGGAARAGAGRGKPARRVESAAPPVRLVGREAPRAVRGRRAA